jgi:hypothetical protein
VARYQVKGDAVPTFFSKAKASVTTGARLIRQDSLLVRRDGAANSPDALRKKIVNRDRLLIGLDEGIWLCELTQEMVSKHNAAHPEYPEADVTDVLSLEMEFRGKFVDLANKYRNALPD